jgi:cytochrome d ubiquinol oxidase subunit II
MENINNFQELWFMLIFLLFLGYTLLDGFDLGVGMLMPFITGKKEEKDILIGTIAPVWDGNEVWLVTGAGALFAAFPLAYATALSGFYIPIMLVLFSLIFRAVSMEFRANDEKRTRVWEAAFTGGSFLTALLFGIALGNVVYGVQLDNHQEYAGDFFTLFRPVPLLLHGACYLVRKTEGELQNKILEKIPPLLLINAATALVYVVTMASFFTHIVRNVFFYIAVILTISGIGATGYWLKKKKEHVLIWASSIFIIGLWITVGCSHFPNLINATNDPDLTINIYNASTGIKALQVMSVIALAGMPIVVGYSLFVYRIFKGKIKTSQY